MAKRALRRRALRMRLRGMSYRQIREQLPVSKSILSLWLREHPLSPERVRALRDWSQVRIEKFRKTMRKKRENRLAGRKEEARRGWLPLSERELFLAGLFLYWGEGNKASTSEVSISNTNPQMIKFVLYWLTRCLGIPREKIKVRLHLYSDMEASREIRYWEGKLQLARKFFLRPYVKKSKISTLDRKGFGHGTCNVLVHHTPTKEQIISMIDVLSEEYGEVPFSQVSSWASSSVARARVL
jgi:hypothetical protein